MNNEFNDYENDRLPDNNDNEDGQAGMEITAQASEIIDAVNEPKGFNLRKEILEWLYAIVSALIIVAIIKGFIFDVVKVDGRSMETTLLNNDRLILTKMGYKPKQTDIIVLDSNYKKRSEYIEKVKQEKGEAFSSFDEFRYKYFTPTSTGLKPRYYVKRVIATEGQVIDIDKEGNVTVDGVKLNEPYLKGVKTQPHNDLKFPYKVEEGHIFVMGDNRANSQDSRSATLGTVPNKAVLGKAVFRIWPFTHFGAIY